MFSIDSLNDTKMRVDGLTDFEANRETTTSIGLSSTRFGFIGDGSEASTFDGTRNNIYYDGEIAEIIYFENSNLTYLELGQVETYLALKYGSELSSDYVVSGGTVIWDRALDPTYSNHIGGIGRDDGTNIDQRKTISENGEGIVIMEKSAGFSLDGAFLMWGNDNASAGLTETGTPANYQYKLSRTWRAKTTGTPGLVSVSFILSEIGLVSSGDPNDYALVIDSDSDFSSSATEHTAGASLSGDTITFTGVSFSDGDYFTLVLNDYQPGGIGGYEFWLTAEKGVFEDALGTNPVEDGDEILALVDQSGNGHDGDEDANGMLYNNSNLQLNFHAVLEGTSSSRGFDIANANEINLLDEDQKSYVIGFKTGADITTTQFLFEEGGATNGLGLYVSGGRVYASGWTEGTAPTWETYLNTSVEPNTAYVLNFVLDGNVSGTGTVNAYLNGSLIGTYSAAGTLRAHSGDIHLGTNQSSQMHTGNYSTTSSFTGEIAEMLYYNQKVFSGSEIADFESYFAIKYGMHLSGDYINSSGGTVWDASINSAYHNDVTIIGRDDDFTLNQQSSITEDGESIMGMTVNTAVSDLEFLCWGHDGSSLDLIDNQPASYESRLERVWYVQKDAAIGTVDVKVLVQDAGLISTNASEYALLIDIDTDFSDATSYLGSFDGDTLEFTSINFNTGDYFSLAASSIAPGGVDSGLVLWYNSEVGIDDPTSISEWQDLSGNAFDAVQSISSSMPSVVDSINFHPVVSYDGDDYLAIESLNYATSGALDNLSLFVVYKSDYPVGNSQSENWSFLDFDRSEYFNFYLHGNSTFGLSYEAGGSIVDNYTTSSGFNDNEPRVVTALYDNTRTNDTRIVVNGNTEFEVDVLPSSTSLGNGSTRFGFIGDGSEATGFNGSRNGSYFEGEIAEMIFYQNNVLSEGQIEGVQSYLGLKYGMHLTHSYRMSDTSIIWDASTLSTYHHQVAGVIRDDGSTLNQTKSRSVSDSSLILINRTTSWGSDREYLLWGNDAEATEWIDGEVPNDLYLKLEREWRVESSGSISNVTLSLDTTSLQEASGVYGWFLLTDADGDFSANATVFSMTKNANGMYEVSGLTLQDNSYFTFAKIANITSQSGDFNIGTTWVSGSVPQKGERIVVNDNHTLNMVGDVTLFSVKLNSNATINLNSHVFTLNEGTFNSEPSAIVNTGTSEVIYNYNGDQDIAGLDYYDLTIDSSGTKTVVGVARVSNEIELLSSSVTLDANGNLTIGSHFMGTGRVLEIPSGATITGDVTVERYVGATARKWWHLSAPVSGATVQDWRNDFPITGDFIDSSDLGGSNNASVYWYDETQIDANSGIGWEAFPDNLLSEGIVTGRGYRAFLRQDGSNPLNDTVIDLTGALNYGTQVLGVSYSTSTPSDTAAAGWCFVGNPYPSEIDWNNSSGWTSNNMSDGIYVWNALSGIYQSYVNGVGVNGGTGRVASGQGFWVRAIDSSPSLVLNEAAKTTMTTPLYKQQVSNLVYITLSDQSHSANMALRFEEDATHDFDSQYDGYYFGGDHPINICSYDPQYNYYAIEGLPLNEELEVPLYLLHPDVIGEYQLSFDNLSSFDDDPGLLLIDLYEGTSSEITNELIYSFDFNGSPASNGSSRFLIQKEEPIITGEPNEDSHELVVFPTLLEAGSEFHVLSTSGIINGVQVFDVEGRSVYNDVRPGHNISISALFGKGVFVISVQRGNSFTHRKLIVE